MTSLPRRERRRLAQRKTRDPAERRRLAAALKDYEVGPDGKLERRESEAPPGESRRRSGLFVLRPDIEVPVLTDAEDAIVALPAAGEEA